MNSPVSERVIRKVSKTTDSEALELPPLHEAIDPEALDALVLQMTDGEVVFTYANFEITVTSAGTVTLDDQHAS